LLDEKFHLADEWSKNEFSFMMRLKIKYETFDDRAVAYVFIETTNAGAPVNNPIRVYLIHGSG
jgi:hypothetical protein